MHFELDTDFIMTLTKNSMAIGSGLNSDDIIKKDISINLTSTSCDWVLDSQKALQSRSQIQSFIDRKNRIKELIKL